MCIVKLIAVVSFFVMAGAVAIALMSIGMFLIVEFDLKWLLTKSFGVAIIAAVIFMVAVGLTEFFED